ncbi:MAG TPA: WHG domain-containing protein [Balneolales bacterium]|nr:WHG domain-containing protein [Balneolales bacterium]
MPRRAKVDKNKVVAMAANLVNREGVDALSLNRLASELGIKPPSLYNHINGLPHLLIELSILNTRKMAENMTQAVIGKSGPDAIRSLAYAYRSHIKENPGLYLVTLKASNNQQVGSPELRSMEGRVISIVQAVIAPYGLSEEDSLHTIRGFRSVVHGFTTIEIAGGFGLSLDCDESFDRIVAMFIDSLEKEPMKSGN